MTVFQPNQIRAAASATESGFVRSTAMPAGSTEGTGGGVGDVADRPGQVCTDGGVNGGSDTVADAKG